MTQVNKDETEKVGFWKNWAKSMKLDTKSIAMNAIIAAMYAALTYAFFFCSYGPLQVRISEFMVLLAFFNPNYIYGLTIGCIVSNIYSPAFSAFCSPLDIAIGTLATLIAALLISFSRHLFVASIFPALSNGFLLAFEFTFLTNGEEIPTPAIFWTNFGWVCLGEVIAVCVLGYIIFMLLSKTRKQSFFKMIHATQNLNFRF